MPLSTYRFEDAMKNMRSVMFHPDRVDYRDRHLAGLEPAHRVAWTHHRQTGILAPFSAKTSHLTEPNRLLFAPDGEWLTLDNADPVEGWDVSAVLASGERHGIHSNDIYGCLFFHIKDEFEEFARRIERFKIDIHLTQFDATALSETISKGLMRPWGPGCFDRIETSNMADYIGPAEIINCWGPLINKHNKHATLLMYFMNWHIHQPRATFASLSEIHAQVLRYPLMTKTAAALGIDLRAIIRDERYGVHSAPLLRIAASMDVFLENSMPFETFLRDNNAIGEAKSRSLRIRTQNKIHTKRFGIPLSMQHLNVPAVTQKEFYNTCEEKNSYLRLH
ncbi:hypothetical protein HWV62_29923 [Athelia sp. TMB]|nr:hypothetical protein HWV62_29923 [Athelia sp. TMB]